MIVAALCEPVLSDGLTMQIGVSIGIAMAPDHASDQDELFRRADMTMYVAKRSGGGWAVWQPEYEEETARSFHLAGALREAIDMGRITVEYQPRMSIESNRVVGFEGLARWHDPRSRIGRPDGVRRGCSGGRGQPAAGHGDRAHRRRRPASPARHRHEPQGRGQRHHDRSGDAGLRGHVVRRARCSRCAARGRSSSNCPRARRSRTPSSSTRPCCGCPNEASGCRSTTSVRATRRWTGCARSRCTRSRSTSRS